MDYDADSSIGFATKGRLSERTFLVGLQSNRVGDNNWVFICSYVLGLYFSFIDFPGLSEVGLEYLGSSTAHTTAEW